MPTERGQNGWLFCAEAREALTRLGSVLERAVRSDNVAMEEVALHLISLGGKRLRPTLLFLAHGGEAADDTSLKAAASVELIHLASLYHDDVMDRAVLRRGVLTVNARWSNSVAALAGTYLFSRAGLLLSSLGDEELRLASEAATRLCVGQLREAENAYNPALSSIEHLDILSLKTASLFELSARLGTLRTARPAAAAEALADYGRHLGLAFQLYDDVMDLSGDPGAMGKHTGCDFRNGIYSFPILTLLEQKNSQAEKLRLLLQKRHMAASDIDEVLRLLRDSESLKSSLRKANAEAQAAQNAIEVLPAGAVRESLRALADYAVNRSN